MHRAMPLLMLFFVAFSTPVLGRQEIVTVESRVNLAGEKIRLSYFLDAGDATPPDKVLVITGTGGGRMGLGEMKLPRRWDNNSQVFLRNAPRLQAMGFAIVVVDVPSDHAGGLDLRFRSDSLHHKDVMAAAEDAARRLGGAKIYLAGADTGATSAMGAAVVGGSRVSGVIIAGGSFGLMRNLQYSRINAPVLILHHVDDECTSSSLLDAKAAADEYKYSFVALGGGKPAPGATRCGTASLHGLFGKDAQALEIVADWSGGKLKPSYDPVTPQSWFQEEVTFIDAGRSSGKRETTIFRPRGEGPFPLLILNHGASGEQLEVEEIVGRYRMAPQALEFVKRGYAVAIPMRSGYGRSDGNPRTPINCFSQPTAEDEAEDIRAVANYMAGQPYIDARRILVGGQSAGGYVSVAFSAQAYPGLLGILNFAGGMRSGGMGARPMCWRANMVRAYGQWGKTSRVPQIWVYTANDQSFDPAIASESYAAFAGAGGKATYLPKPAFGRNGHYLFESEDGIKIWLPDVEKFLAELGLSYKPDARYSGGVSP